MSHIFQFPDDVYRAIETYAAHRRQSPEDVILDWAMNIQCQVELEQGVVTTNGGKGYDSACDPWAGFRGAFEAVEDDLIERHDEYLAEEYVNSHESE